MPNYFKENLLLYKTPEAPRSSGDVIAGKVGLGAFQVLDMEDNKSSQPQAPVSTPDAGALTEAGTNVPTTSETPTPAPEIVSDMQRGQIREQIQREVFGGNPELQKKYVEAVRDAIETLDPDLLHKFILEHTPPQESYGSGEYRKWNKDFYDLIGSSLPEDLQVDPSAKDSAMRYRYVVGGMQQYLVESFSTNVFQAGKKKKDTNPFVYVDGLLGGYTISVLAEHWNGKYGPQKPNLTALTRGGIDGKYASKGSNKQQFAEAMEYLDAQLGKSSESTPLVADALQDIKKNSVREIAIGIRDTLRGQGAESGAIYAFEQSWKGGTAIHDQIGEIIGRDDLGLQKKEDGRLEQTAVNWNKIHGYMMQNEEYRKAFEASQVVATQPVEAITNPAGEAEVAQENAGEQPKPETIRPAETVIEGRTSEPETVIATLDSLPDISPESLSEGEGKGLKKLADKYREREEGYKKENRERIYYENFRDLQIMAPPDYVSPYLANAMPKGHEYEETAGRGPEYTWYVNSIKNLPERSWPNYAFRLYETAYSDWETVNRNYESRIKNNPLVSNPELEEKKLADAKAERDQAFDNLCIALGEYVNAQDELRDDAVNSYEQRLYKLASQYDFPEGIDLSDIYDRRGHLNLGDANSRINISMYFRQAAPHYLKEIPKKIINNVDDIRPYIKGNTNAEKDKNAVTLGNLIQSGEDFVTMINSLIYVANCKRFDAERVKLGTEMQYEYIAKRDEISNKPFTTMLAEAKKKEGRVEKTA